MSLTLLTGGARAGKSAMSVRLAEHSGLPVVFIATAEALDDDMRARIERHRAERPRGWTTIEEPLELERALAEAPENTAAIVDCLTLWVSNLLLKGEADDDIVGRARNAAATAARREAPTLVVTNEVGSGVHPASELGRRYRDLLGWVNAIWSSAATDAFLVVAGRSIRLQDAP
jgi:adenosyl cobinamide kinase/adenosyl cobinamide phosphate guanylyltransferase